MKKQYQAKVNYEETSDIIKSIDIKIDFKQLKADSVSEDIKIELTYFITDILDDMLDTEFIIEE